MTWNHLSFLAINKININKYQTSQIEKNINSKVKKILMCFKCSLTLFYCLRAKMSNKQKKALLSYKFKMGIMTFLKSLFPIFCKYYKNKTIFYVMHYNFAKKGFIAKFYPRLRIIRID